MRPDLSKILRFLSHFNTTPSTARQCQPRNYCTRKVGESGRAWLVENFGVWHFVHDNGGELMVERVNSGELAVAVPLTWFGIRLNDATVAMRLAMVLRGEPINYDERMDEEDEQILEPLAACS